MEKEKFIKENDLIQVEGWNTYYINSKGEVYSYKDGFRTRKGWRKLKPETISKYRYVNFVEPNKKKTRYAVHRLVAQYFCDGFSPNLVVNHIDGDPSNNNSNNLEWVTQRVNVNKSYQTSGVNQTRNYWYYQLKFPDGTISKEKFKGFNDFKCWFDTQQLPISALTLRNRKKLRGYELIKTK